jgi:hypothetical protein
MEIVHCSDRTGSSAEDLVLESLRRSNVRGIALSNLLTGGRDSREIDVLVVTDSGRIVVVEVKATNKAGRLSAFANASWTIDDQSAYFAGGPQPHRQAKVAAARVSKCLSKTKVTHPWVEWVVAIVGPVQLNAPTRVDNGWVCRADQLSEFLSRPSEAPVIYSDLAKSVPEAFDVSLPPPSEGVPLTRGSYDSAAAEALGSTVFATSPKSSHPGALEKLEAPSGVETAMRGFAGFWLKPRREWTKKRRFGFFLLIWYVGLLALQGIITLASLVIDHSSAVHGVGINCLYLCSFVVWGIVVFNFVRSKSPASRI